MMSAQFPCGISAAPLMSGLNITLIVLGALLVQYAIFVILGSYIVFAIVLRRGNKNKWTRQCSFPDDPQQRIMYAVGAEWAQANASCKKDLHIVNEGLNLYAEYYDFGSERTCVIVPGRTEGLCYGYYFAKPYHELGFNILTIDQRSHGLSDGKYNTLGFNEHRDLIAWSRYLHDELGTKSIYLHGICIGSACSLYAMTSEDCPDYIIGMTAEGMYANFFESFVQHAKEKHKKSMLVLNLSNLWFRLFTHCNMKKGPIDVISSYKKPLLMLHSREDFYSLPERAEALYAACGSDIKQLVWFEHGAHSMLRITDTAKYDASIKDYMSARFGFEG